jgi:type 1 glutamine amidotransferase
MDHPDLEGMPVVWTRPEGDGRVAYCSLGHTDEAFAHDAFRRLLVRSVEWTAD